jgi:PAS domain S-box-containing protein
VFSCRNYSIDNSAHGSTGVSAISPENSEDGGFPTIGDSTKRNQNQIQQVGPPSAELVAPQFATAPMPYPNYSKPVPTMPPADTSMVYHQHGMVLPQNGNDSQAKRRRMEANASMRAAPMMAVAGFAGMPPSTNGLNGQMPPMLPGNNQMLPGNNGLNGQMPPGNNGLNGQQLAAAAAQAIQSQGRSRKKSQAQIDRRRERNRILARRTRLRKKFFFEALQKEVMDLQRENGLLKDVVNSNIDEENAAKILEGCNAADSLPDGVLEACAEENEMDSQDVALVKGIQRSQHSFVITDPSLQDNPIVFVSDDFLDVTGYKREQVLGRNCRFLQGTDTNKEKVDQVRKTLANGEDVTVTMINYMADGTPFWNKLFIAALRDSENNIVNFIGVTVKVARPEPGDPEFGVLLPGQKPMDSGDDDGDDDDDDDDN